MKSNLLPESTSHTPSDAATTKKRVIHRYYDDAKLVRLLKKLEALTESENDAVALKAIKIILEINGIYQPTQETWTGASIKISKSHPSQTPGPEGALIEERIFHLLGEKH